MSYASLNGNQVLKATITIPMTGTWTADVVLEAEPQQALTGLLTLSVGSLTLRGTAARAGSFVGGYSARIVGGYLGWRRELSPKSYQSAFGLKLAPILTDAAREAGEQVNVTDDRTLAPAYVRRKAKGSRLLWELYPSWWMGLDGVTQIGARADSIVGSVFDVTDYDPYRGRVTVATSFPEAFVPNVRFTGVTTPELRASLVVHEVEQSKLRTVVYAN
jgi:hypothetical protein